MAETQTGFYKAIVKENGRGIPYITFELLSGEGIQILHETNIGFYLEDSTSYEEAENIAKVINAKIKNLFLTRF
jgi:hypothetical protein